MEKNFRDNMMKNIPELSNGEHLIKDTPFEIPNDWKWVKLGDPLISKINPKKTEVRKFLDDNIDVSFVPMECVDDISGQISEKRHKNINEVYSGYTYFKEGDIIFAKITPCMENGKCAIAENLENKIGFGSTEFHVIRLNKNIDKRWVWYLLRLLETRKEAKSQFTGAVGHKRVPVDFLEELIIPLPFKNGIPNLTLQSEILNKVEIILRKVQHNIEKRQSTLKKDNLVINSVVAKLFAEAISSDDWKWVKLEKITDFNLGKTPKRSETSFWNNGIYPWVTISDMRNRFITKTKEKISEVAYNDIFKKKIVPNGTLLMSFKLTLGRTAILNIDAFHNEAIISIYPKLNIDKEYLFWILPYINYQKYVNDAIKGKTLNKKILKTVLVPIPCNNNKPDLKMQKKVARYLNGIDAEITKLKHFQNIQLQRLIDLRESVLINAFKGQL